MGKSKKRSSIWILLIVAIIVVIFVGGYFFAGDLGSEEITEPGEYDSFVQCLVDSGVKMYGSVTCSVCAQQKKLLGNSFRLIDEIECNPYEKNSQAELCLEVEVETTPTWVLERDGTEVDRVVGFQSIETLSEFSGCSV
jgi:flagellar basal body-associated protein FliL